GRERKKLAFFLALGPDGAGSLADEVGPVPAALLAQSDSRLVRACLPAGNPDDEDRLAVDLVWNDHRMIRRSNGAVSELKDLLLDGIESFLGEPLRRQHRQAILLLDADDDVATTEIVEVVGETTDGVQDSDRV